MTEVLPIADISLTQLQQAGREISSNDIQAEGVCVGHPLPGVLVQVDPLDDSGQPIGVLSTEPGVLGEIMVQAAHARDGYDRLWLTNHKASQPAGWHRTGDVGQLDPAGRLWVGGRLGHVITTPQGVLAPVESEQRIETLSEVRMAAVVGVGPAGTQVIVAVVEIPAKVGPTGGASMELTDQVRNVVGKNVDIAAVLAVRKLPVDRRHNSKVDRSAVAVWASRDIGWRVGGVPVKILVTGATSLIGRHIVSRLVERGDQVTVMQRSPSGIEGVAEICCDIASSGTESGQESQKTCWQMLLEARMRLSIWQQK